MYFGRSSFDNLFGIQRLRGEEPLQPYPIPALVTPWHYHLLNHIPIRWLKWSIC